MNRRRVIPASGGDIGVRVPERVCGDGMKSIDTITGAEYEKALEDAAQQILNEVELDPSQSVLTACGHEIRATARGHSLFRSYDPWIWAAILKYGQTAPHRYLDPHHRLETCDSGNMLEMFETLAEMQFEADLCVYVRKLREQGVGCDPQQTIDAY